MRSALGIELRTGRLVRAWEDGRTEVVAAADITGAVDVVALVTAVGLDAAAWREWVTTRFGFSTLDVTEDVARGFAEDVAAGAALWALDRERKSGRAAAVPPLVPGTGEPASDASAMGDFGEGRSMSDFGEGNTMGDFKEPAQMSDFGDGSRMADFGEGKRLADSVTQPAAPTPAATPPTPIELPPPLTKPRNLKLQIAVAAAVVITVAAGATAVLALAGNNSTSFPVASTPPPPPVTTPSTLDEASDTTEFTQGTRFYDVTFTVTLSNAPDGEPLSAGYEGVADLAVSCGPDGECWTTIQETGTGSSDQRPLQHLVIVDLVASSFSGRSTYEHELSGCEGVRTHGIRADMFDGEIQGQGFIGHDPEFCDFGGVSERATVVTFEFSGVLRDEVEFVIGNPPATIPDDGSAFESDQTTSTSTTTTTAPASADAFG